MYDLNHILNFFKSRDWDISFSGGKDSTATVILAQQNNIPIHQLQIVNMRFNETISAKLPEDFDFFNNMVYKLKIPYLKIDVPSYYDLYNKVLYKSKDTCRNGNIYGGACCLRGHCGLCSVKITALKKNKSESVLVGIASDETKRLKRIKYPNYSILQWLNVNEKMCFDICKENNMLLPLYNYTNREGCWFCPNANYKTIAYIHQNYPQLYRLYIDMLLDTPKCFPTWKDLHNWIKYFRTYGK